MLDLKDILKLMFNGGLLSQGLFTEFWKMVYRNYPQDFINLSLEKKTEFQKESALALELMIGISSIDSSIIVKNQNKLNDYAKHICNHQVCQ